MPLPSSLNTGEEHGEQSGNRGSYQTEISGETPKSCILLVDLVLDGNNKLPHETYKHLKETYQTLRERNLSQ